MPYSFKEMLTNMESFTEFNAQYSLKNIKYIIPGHFAKPQCSIFQHILPSHNAVFFNISCSNSATAKQPKMNPPKPIICHMNPSFQNTAAKSLTANFPVQQMASLSKSCCHYKLFFRTIISIFYNFICQIVTVHRLIARKLHNKCPLRQ